VRPVCAGLARLFGRTGAGFGILMYHRISPAVPGFPTPTCNVTPTNFRAQLAGLLARGYEPWPLRKALEWAAAGLPVPANAFVVTFDDGYENVYRHAWPVLRELNVSAMVFLATAYLGSDEPFPFDDWAGAGVAPPETWHPLTREQCAEMRAGGLIELGSHTHTHQVFLGRPGPLAADLSAAATTLREGFGLTAAAFAFPFGAHDPEMVAVVRAAGLRCALTTEMDIVRPGTDPFGWGRFHVEDHDTPGALCGYLGGWYALFRRLGRSPALCGRAT
jgi:peptidoglycan/xylan/chitin deacetylase (PgdA/CDA1 family)